MVLIVSRFLLTCLSLELAIKNLMSDAELEELKNSRQYERFWKC